MQARLVQAQEPEQPRGGDHGDAKKDDAKKEGGEKDEPALPIRNVVMFNSGVAFFEHRGQVDGDAQVRLHFRVEDINDLLKSMVVQDLGGGRIHTVSYASRDPITKTLKTFAIDLTSNPTLADLLGQIRGERVEVHAPNAVTGAIIGVEKREVPAGDEKSKPIEQAFLNLLTDDGLRSVNLSQVSRIRVLNPRIDAELRQALMTLALDLAEGKKAVELHFAGEGERTVRVGYIQEAPVWKTSYRLVLDNDEKPFLQGWAIVENTTEEDWKDVNLTLVSGRPISFLMDLYQPLYVSRPEVQLELYSSLRPQRYDQDLAAADANFRRAGEQAEKAKAEAAAIASNRAMLRDADRSPPAPRAAAAPGFAMPEGRSREVERFNLQQGVQSVAQAENVGELFQYRIENPVALARQQSAMLSIVNGSVEGEKLSIYNARVHAKHPLNGLQLTNTTDLHLMQGPITVFDDGAYAGDAQIPDLEPQSTRLISYAMDLATEVAQTANTKPQTLISGKLVKGVLTASYRQQRTHDFVVKNSSAREKKVLIEHPKTPGWDLVSEDKPAETTRDMYRFAVQAKPGEPAKLSVVEQQTVAQVVALNNASDDAIRFYLNSPVISQQVKDALAEVIKRKQELSQLEAQRQRLQQELAAIDQEQTRIRQNMERLDRTTDLYNRYVKKLTEQEDQVDALRKQVNTLAETIGKKKTELDEFLIGLTLE